jgi:hypothetical protein
LDADAEFWSAEQYDSLFLTFILASYEVQFSIAYSYARGPCVGFSGLL